MKTITIFIPTFNAMEQIGPLLRMFSEISRPNYKFYFLDSNSTDGTLAAIQDAGFENYHSTTPFQFDHGGTRSAIKNFDYGDIVLYLTQDALPSSFADIDRLISVFSDDGVGAAFGRQIPYQETNLFGKHLRSFNYRDQSYVRDIGDKDLFGIKTAFLSNSFAAYRRSAMEEIDWFKAGLILGEDCYAGAKLLQAGYKLVYNAEAKVFHSHSYTVMEEFKRYFDIGVFHQMENWILDDFGKPEGEGMRYIRSEFDYILDLKAYHLIPEFFARNGMKFLGYKMGKNYEILPKQLIKKLSMHYRWWDKHWTI